ncbi:MAG: hypothetical protein J6P58_02905 [Oscillospiraceae bacterium]|nr:hypothetical protein [Oscillospiraceae bacterium]
MYRAFAALSEGLGGDLAEPPESLRENVMAEIRREQIRERNRRPFRVGGFVAAAAVLALVIGFAPRFLGSSHMGNPPMTAQMAAGAKFAAQEEYAYEDDLLEEPETEPEDPSDALAESRSAYDAEDSMYVTMDTEAAAAAEAAQASEEEEDDSYVIFGVTGFEDAEMEENGAAWFDETADEDSGISMSALLFCLEGSESELDPELLPVSPTYLIATDAGVVEIYRYRNDLYYYDPLSGILCEADCTENDLIRFLAS